MASLFIAFLLVAIPASAASIQAHPDRIQLVESSGARQLAGRNTLRPLRLKSGTFTGAGELAANLKDARATVPDGSSVHVLIQFNRVPRAEDRSKLAAAAVTLLGYLPEDTFFASVQTDASAEALAAAGARWLGRIYPEDKLAATLLAGTPGAWALTPEGTIRLRVRHFEDAASTAVRAGLESAGAAVTGERTELHQMEVTVEAGSVAKLAELDAIRWIEEVPPPASPFNDGLRANLQADEAQAAPYGLSGAGVVVGIWDAGWPDFSHPDFAGRLQPGESSVAETNHFHATHVTGTLLGSGAASESAGGQPAQWRGVAPGATGISYDFSSGNSIAEHKDAVERFDAVLSQNSWGITVSQFFGNCHLLGDYIGEAPNYDRLVTGLYGRPLHVVFAAGNARGRREQSGCPQLNYGTLGVPATAKNVISVGAINSDDNSMTVFSGWGPTDDGRVKPDIVAPGDETAGDGGIKSAQSGATYGTLVGTSMAAPAVSGAVTLLIEDYRARFNGQTPLPATTKALLIHTAADLSDESDWFQPGPDYSSGYGRLQIRDAVDQLRAGGFLIGQVGDGQEIAYNLEVAANATQVKVTLVWDDLPANENAARTLVNDLDLIVHDAAGVQQFPWTLDMTNPAAPARRDQEDHVNVVEQVLADSDLAPGSWRIAVRGTRVAGTSPQKFTLVFTPQTIPAAPLLAIQRTSSSDLAGGNGNGFVDRGEVIQETIVLLNTDGPVGTNVTVKLAALSPLVQVLSSETSYPAILPGASATNETAFSYRVSKEAACGEVLPFELVQVANGERRTNSLTRVVGRLEITNVATHIFTSTNVPLPIPDSGAASSVLPVEVEGTLLGAKVAIRVDHPWLDDLRLTLSPPEGSGVMLVESLSLSGVNLGQGACEPNSDFTHFDDAATARLADGKAPYVGSFKPHQPLAALNNRALKGDWKLLVVDTSLEDTGTLQCWNLELHYQQQGYLCDIFNHSPLAPDQTLIAYFSRPTLLALQASDADEDSLRFHVVTAPAHGTLTDFDTIAGTARYTPDPGYIGLDSFSFKTTDGYDTSSPGTVSVEVRPATSDLVVNQALSPPEPVHGELFAIGITVTNRGPSHASGVWLTNILSRDIEWIGATASQGVLSTNGPLLVVDVGTIPENGSVTVSIIARAALPGWYASDTQVRATEIEPAPEDNSSSLTIPILTTAELALYTTAPIHATPLGHPFKLTLVATNLGPYAATNVLLRYPLPASAELASAAVSQGSWTNANGVFLASLQDLDATKAAFIELDLLPRSLDVMTNLFLVSAQTPDPNPSNNWLGLKTEVRSIANLAVGWHGNGLPVAQGEWFTNTLSVTNLGPATASTVIAEAAFVGDIDSASTTHTEGIVNFFPGGLTWNLSELAAGAEAHLKVALRSARSGSFTNTLTATAFEFDLQPENNHVTALLDVRRQADLAVGYEWPNLPIVADRSFVYALSLTNQGPDAATEVLLHHSPPPGFTVKALRPSKGVASELNGIISAEFEELEPGESARLEIEVTPTHAGYSESTFAAAAFEVDPNPSNNFGEFEFNVGEHADLAVSLEATPLPAHLHQALALTITVTNVGPYEATGVQVAALLPEGLDFQTAEGANGSFNKDGNQITFQLGNLPVGVSFTGVVHAVCTQLGLLTNHVTVSSLTPDLHAANDSAELAIPVRPTADLAITSWRPVDPVVIQHEARFSLALTNRGPSTSHGITLTATLPPGIAFSGITGASFVEVSGSNFAAQIADLESGAGTILTLRLRPTTGGSYAVGIEVRGGEDDLQPDNNAARVEGEIAFDADLAVTCGSLPSALIVGQAFSLALAVTNNGPYVATNVVLSDLLSNGLAFRPDAAAAGWSFTGGKAKAYLGNLDPGGGKELTLPVVALQSGTHLSTAIAVSDQADLLPVDNECRAMFEVQRTADLALRKSAAPVPAAFALPLRYMITVTNAGPDEANQILLKELLADFMPVSNVTLSQGVWTKTTGGLDWEVGTLPASTAATMELTVTPMQMGWLTNSAVVSAFEPDPDPTNNNIEFVTPVRQPADLALTLVGPAEPVILGTPVSYAFTVQNFGPSNATEVALAHLLPPGFTFIDLKSQSGVSVFAGGTVQWRIPELVAGATATVEITATPQVAATVTNSATVTAFEADPEPGNNLVEQHMTVRELANLSLTHDVTPNRVYLGSEAVFRLSVTNLGPHAATQVQIVNHLPAGVSLISAESSQGEIVAGPAELSYSIGRIEPGAVATAQFLANGITTGTHTNLSVVAAQQLDLHPEDNQAESVLEVLPNADLALSQTVLNLPALLGQPLQFSLAVTNRGPGRATAITVRNTLPPGVDFLEAETADGAHRLESGDFVFQPNDLEAGGQASVRLTLKPNELGSFANLARVSAAEHDPEPADNSVETTVDVRLGADLSVLVAPPAGPALVGETLDLLVTVTNRGPHLASAVRLKGRMPDGLALSRAESSQGVWEVEGQMITALFGELPSAAAATLRLTGQATREEVLQFIFNADSALLDPAPGDNEAQFSIESRLGSDLVLEMIADVTEFAPSRAMTCWLVVNNRGLSQARDVIVTNLLPAAAELLEASTGQGTVEANGDLVLCHLGSIPSGAEAVVQLSLRVNAIGPFTNSATAGALTFDPRPANNTASIAGTVFPEADVVVSAALAPPSLLLSNQIALTFTITNRGAIPAPRTQMLVAFSLNVDILSAQLDRGSYYIQEPGIVMDFKNLEAGESALVAITVRPTRLGTLVAQATAFSPAINSTLSGAGARMEIPVVNTPTLQTERTGNRLLLTWPAVAADFELDYTDNLAAPWQSLLTPRFVVGDRITVNIKLTSPARYYRLRRQEAEAQVPGN